MQKRKIRNYQGSIDPDASRRFASLQVAGRPDFYGQLILSYLEMSRNFMQNLDLFLNGQPDVSVRGPAHSWKASAYNIGALDLGDLCAELEATDCQAHPETCRELIREIKNEHQQALVELEALRDFLLS